MPEITMTVAVQDGPHCYRTGQFRLCAFIRPGRGWCSLFRGSADVDYINAEQGDWALKKLPACVEAGAEASQKPVQGSGVPHSPDISPHGSPSAGVEEGETDGEPNKFLDFAEKDLGEGLSYYHARHPGNDNKITARNIAEAQSIARNLGLVARL